MIATPTIRRHPQDTEEQERRRAFFLSLTLHLALLYLFIYLQSLPQPIPTETYLVIDLGEPAKGEVNLAATVSETAPANETVNVADNTIGEPASAAPAPSETVSTQNTPAPSETVNIQANPTPAATQTISAPIETAAATPDPTPQPTPNKPIPPTPTEAAAANTNPQATAASEPDLRVTPNVALTSSSIPVAQAQASLVESQVVTTPQVVTSAVATLSIPTPQIQASVTESQTVPKPQVQASVAESQAVPKPQVQASVAESQAVPKPQAQASVAESQAVPKPQVQASITESQAVPKPQVQASVTELQAVPKPQVQASVTESQAVPKPQVQASVAESQAVPKPQAQASVAESQAVPKPQVQASVAESQAVPKPQAQTSVSAATRNVPKPQVQATIGSSQAIPSPQVQVNVSVGAIPSQNTGQNTQGQDARATPASTTSPNNDNATAGTTQGQNPTGDANNPQTTAPQGGSGPTTTQTAEQDNANPNNSGAAAQPNGVNKPTGAPPPPEPFRQKLDRPLAVMVDNVGGYPQRGFKEASAIYEMPVEGGYTRLMMIFDRANPSNVGPIRSARDYFHTLSESFNGILVHDGGSPAALQQIAASSTPTLNAFYNGDLFARDSSRNAPYNLYSTGTKLRDAINRLNLNRSKNLSGIIYRPAESSTDSPQKTINISSTYRSGFNYVPSLNLYHWQRNGTNASDAYGEAVLVDAIVVAKVSARKIPGDEAGRLYVSLSGGEASLFLRGKEISGRWSTQGGFNFFSGDGKQIDLAPFKHWVVFMPPWSEIR